MVKLKEHKKPLKLAPERTKGSSIEERWAEDAKWYEADAKKNPDKYSSDNDELQVTSKEMNKYLEDFINETDQPSVNEKSFNYRDYRRRKSWLKQQNRRGRKRLKQAITAHRRYKK